MNVAADDIRVVRPAGFAGEGRSRGLARGLLVYCNELNLTGEGMGIGSVALKGRNGTCFSRSYEDSEKNGEFRRTFVLDTRLEWGIGGRPVSSLSRSIQWYTWAYMKMPWLQERILAPALRLRTGLGITPLFVTIPSPGAITLKYKVTGRCVDVRVSCSIHAGPQERLCILNELSAAWFTAGWDGERLVPPPPGWREVNASDLPVYLADPSHGIRFFLKNPSVEPLSRYRMYEGREFTGDLNWAGFCIELEPRPGSGSFPGLQYSVGLDQEAVR